MKTAHEKDYNQYGNGKAAAQQQLLHKRKADETLPSAIPKQPKISSFFEGSVVMKLCVGLVVNSGRPFSIFKDKDMKSLINLAKKQTNEKIDIYPENVKAAVKAAAEKKRAEIRLVLVRRVVSLSIDMATSRHRSFIGKSKMIQVEIFLNSVYTFIGVNVQLFLNGGIRVINLACREVKDRHFAVNIQKWIQEDQHKFEIIDPQIIALAIDSARNMTRAVDDFIDNLSKEENESDEDDGRRYDSRSCRITF